MQRHGDFAKALLIMESRIVKRNNPTAIDSIVFLCLGQWWQFEKLEGSQIGNFFPEQQQQTSHNRDPCNGAFWERNAFTHKDVAICRIMNYEGWRRCDSLFWIKNDGKRLPCQTQLYEDFKRWSRPQDKNLNEVRLFFNNKNCKLGYFNSGGGWKIRNYPTSNV